MYEQAHLNTFCIVSNSWLKISVFSLHKSKGLITRNNALILATLYEVGGQDKGTASRKADRTALLQVAVAYQAGHEVNMQSIMQHEFMLVSNPTRWV